MGGMASYTDLVSCLEMARDARQLNQGKWRPRTFRDSQSVKSRIDLDADRIDPSQLEIIFDRFRDNIIRNDGCLECLVSDILRA